MGGSVLRPDAFPVLSVIRRVLAAVGVELS